MIELSIVVPGIRSHKWGDLYRSIKDSYSGVFELIFIGPSIPEQIKDIPEVKFICDFGSPMRSSQIGAVSAKGKYITWGADDCKYFKNTIDIAVETLKKESPKTVITGKYTEGDRPEDWKIQLSHDYQIINHSYPRTPYVDDKWLIFNVGFMYTEYFFELGGWDCQFEACPLGHTDLAIRAQRDGAKVILLDKPVLSCEHMPARSGDHAPVHDAHMYHDEPIFKNMYNNPNCINRIKISLDNWKQAPERWTRRFS